MDADEKEEAQAVAEMIRNGTYFREARAWYQTVYLTLVHERAFYLLVSVLAIITGLFALIAFSALEPISTHPPLLIASRDIDAEIPYILKLRPQGEKLNRALMRFFVFTYIASRESYVPKELDMAQAFVSAHSDPAVLTAYLATIAPGSPQNPNRQIAAAGGERKVTLELANISRRGDLATARVIYRTTEVINNQTTQARWQVDLAMHYTPLEVKEVVDKQTGRTIIQTQDPQFQVVQYDRKQLQ